MPINVIYLVYCNTERKKSKDSSFFFFNKIRLIIEILIIFTTNNNTLTQESLVYLIIKTKLVELLSEIFGKWHYPIIVLSLRQISKIIYFK